MFFEFFFAQENMQKPASKVAEPAQIQPKSQFLFHKKSPTARLLYNDFALHPQIQEYFFIRRNEMALKKRRLNLVHFYSIWQD